VLECGSAGSVGKVCHSRFLKSTHLNLGIISLIYIYFSKLKIIHYIAYLNNSFRKWISTPYASIFSFLFFLFPHMHVIDYKILCTYVSLPAINLTHSLYPYFQVMFGFLLLLLFFFLSDRKPINHRILVSQQYNLLIVALGMWYFMLWCYAIKCI